MHLAPDTLCLSNGNVSVLDTHWHSSSLHDSGNMAVTAAKKMMQVLRSNPSVLPGMADFAARA